MVAESLLCRFLCKSVTPPSERREPYAVCALALGDIETHNLNQT
jgi:hypothetical protein